MNPSRRLPGLVPRHGARSYSWRVDGSAGKFSAPLVARGLLTVVLCLFFVIAFMNLAFYRDGASALVAGAVMAAILALQVGYFCRPRPYGRLRYVALAVEAVLIYAPLVGYGQPWIAMPGFLVGSLLLVLPPAAAVPAAAAVVTSVAFVQASFSGSPQDVAYSTVSCVITGTVTWGLTRLSHVVAELEQARLDIARLEVARERLRIAQDLHDALGATLTAVTLRTELLRGRLRTGRVDAPDADAELADIAGLSRQALTDVRTVASAPLRSTVADEIRQARAVLDAAGVSTTIDADLETLPVAADPVIAPVLREAVTNVLRHGGGRSCAIALTATGKDVVLTVRNDWAGVRPGGDGHGLANMRTRVEQVGGTLRAGDTGDGTWTVTATVPTTPDRAALVGENDPQPAATP
jgi:two-component system sensor histidine kinase DesK